MREFFHGWRRKVGMVTLVMACMVAGVWMRSLSWSDSVSVRTGTEHMLILQNVPGGIGVWRIINPNRVGIDVYFQTGGWISWSVTTTNAHAWGVEDPLFTELMERRRLGFSFLSGGEGPASFWIFIAPCHLPAISLTLFSAYLLLWKPRKREAKRISEDRSN